jgi:hypothetical protein
MVQTRHVADAHRSALTWQAAADLQWRAPTNLHSFGSLERSGVREELTNRSLDQPLLPVHKWAHHVRVNGWQWPSSLLATIFTCGPASLDSVSIGWKCSISAHCKKSLVYLWHFAIKMKTCGFPKVERKCHGSMLTTPSSGTNTKYIWFSHSKVTNIWYKVLFWP